MTLTVTDNDGAHRRVSHDVTVAAPPNAKPTAAFTSTTTNLTAAFDGSGSTDSDGTIASYAWDFGDGATGSRGKPPNHTYAAAGTYTVKLTVTDNDGATDAVSHDVTVTAPGHRRSWPRTTSRAPSPVGGARPTSGARGPSEGAPACSASPEGSASCRCPPAAPRTPT